MGIKRDMDGNLLVLLPLSRLLNLFLLELRKETKSFDALSECVRNTIMKSSLWAKYEIDFFTYMQMDLTVGFVKRNYGT